MIVHPIIMNQNPNISYWISKMILLKLLFQHQWMQLRLLQYFKRHNIGQPMPLSSRTLLKTPRDIKIRQVSNVDYYNFGVGYQIIQNLITNYDDFINDQTDLTLNIDGIPFYKASKV